MKIPIRYTLTLWLLIATMLCGCATWQKNGGKLLASTAVAVDSAMQGWAVWVVDGKATAGDEAKVKLAYIKYQLAMKGASEAYMASVKLGDESIWKRAVAGLMASHDELVALIQNITGKSLPL